MYDFLQVAGFAAILGAAVWFVWSKRSKNPSTKGGGVTPKKGPPRQEP